MFRNLLFIAGLIGGGLVIFFLSFAGDARPRADFIWNNASEPQTLNVLKMSGQPEGALTFALGEGLTVYDPKTLEPLPGVAESWTVDGLTYTFKLRPDAWWVRHGKILRGEAHESGTSGPRRVTAFDFEWTWRTHAYPETGSEYAYLYFVIDGYEKYFGRVQKAWKEISRRYKKEHPDRNVARPEHLLEADRLAVTKFREQLWRDLVKVRALDEDHLEVTLRTAASYFTILTSFYAFFPVPPEVVKRHGERWILPENFASNGPYMLDQWRFNAYIRLRKNPHYWETEEYASRRLREIKAMASLPPYVQRERHWLAALGSFERGGLHTLEALAIEEENTALNLYFNGDVDRLRDLPSNVLKDLVKWSQADPPNPHIHRGPQMAIYYYNLNMTLPVFQGKNGRKLRRALALSLDRKGVVEVVTGEFQLPAYRLVPAGVPDYSDRPLFGSGSYAEDLEQAKRLMSEVRASGHRIPTLKILYNTKEVHAKVAAFLQAVWMRELGLDIQLTNQEWGVYLDSKQNQNYDIVRAGWIGDYPDAAAFLELYTTDNPNNDSKYHSPIYDRLIKGYASRIKDALDSPEKRAAILADLESNAVWRRTIAERRVGGANGESSYREALERRLRLYADQPARNRLEAAADVRNLLLQIAEEFLMYDMPVVPIYSYVKTQLWPPQLDGLYMNLMDTHPPKFFRWRDGYRAGPRYDELRAPAGAHDVEHEE